MGANYSLDGDEKLPFEISDYIAKKQKANLFKLRPMPKFKPEIDCLESIDDIELYNKA